MQIGEEGNLVPWRHRDVELRRVGDDGILHHQTQLRQAVGQKQAPGQLARLVFVTRSRKTALVLRYTIRFCRKSLSSRNDEQSNRNRLEFTGRADSARFCRSSLYFSVYCFVNISQRFHTLRYCHYFVMQCRLSCSTSKPKHQGTPNTSFYIKFKPSRNSSSRHFHRCFNSY